MKKIIAPLILIVLFTSGIKAQDREMYGKTLNIGAGVGYYGTAAALSMNYEFDVFRNFTLAPFASILSYRHYRYWGDGYYPYRYYYYRETTVPVGVKATYYFDELLEAGDHWDFYAGASVGVAFRTVVWENGYYGNRVVREYSSPLYGNLHIGTEYHINRSAGLLANNENGQEAAFIF